MSPARRQAGSAQARSATSCRARGPLRWRYVGSEAARCLSSRNRTKRTSLHPPVASSLHTQGKHTARGSGSPGSPQ
eukprot:14542724-Alexandrium_andersonii.AAC.1